MHLYLSWQWRLTSACTPNPRHAQKTWLEPAVWSGPDDEDGCREKGLVRENGMGVCILCGVSQSGLRICEYFTKSCEPTSATHIRVVQCTAFDENSLQHTVNDRKMLKQTSSQSYFFSHQSRLKIECRPPSPQKTRSGRKSRWWCIILFVYMHIKIWKMLWVGLSGRSSMTVFRRLLIACATPISV